MMLMGQSEKSFRGLGALPEIKLEDETPMCTSSSSPNPSEADLHPEPLDFSTRRERTTTPELRNPWMTSPESGMSSMGPGSPEMLSPGRDSPPPGFHPSHHLPTQPPPGLFSMFRENSEVRREPSPSHHLPTQPPPGLFSMFRENSEVRREPSPERSQEDCTYEDVVAGAAASAAAAAAAAASHGQWPGLREGAPGLAPQLPAFLAHLQHTNPLILSTLCNIASQRVAAEMPGPSSARPPMPPMHPMQVHPGQGMPFMPLAMPPAPLAPLAAPLAASLPLPKLPIGLDVDDESKSNENYLKFRAQIFSKGQIGPKARRTNARNNTTTNNNTNTSPNNNISVHHNNIPATPPKSPSATDPAAPSYGNPDGGAAAAVAAAAVVAAGTSRDPKKDDAYWERRKKNNEAAKRSRDARRNKEDEIAIRAAFLETENIKLKLQVAELKNSIRHICSLSSSNPPPCI